MLYVRLDQVGDETYGLLRDTCLLKASVKYRRVRDIYADFLRVFGGKDISDLDRVDAVNGCAGKVDLIDSSGFHLRSIYGMVIYINTERGDSF